MGISVWISLAGALLILVSRPKFQKRTAVLIGIGALIIGIGALMSRSGSYFALVGVAWLFVASTYFLFILLPGVETWLRRKARDQA